MNKKIVLLLLLLSTVMLQCKSKLPLTEDPISSNYDPGNPDDIAGDTQLKVVKGEASAGQPGEGIENSFDGDHSTIYHSPWNNTEFPVNLTYQFAEAQNVDYLVYKPRPSGDNGLFGQFELWYLQKGSSVYQKIAEYDFKEENKLSTIVFKKQLKDVVAFKFVVKSGKNNFVSCSEMEFYRKGEDLQELANIFADKICSELKNGVTAEQINAMQNSFFRTIAQSMLRDKYPREFRVQEYQAYPTIETTARALKTSGYNPFENPTGIYFASGSDAVILVDDTKGEPISLRVHDFNGNRDGYYPLQTGLNKIKLTNSGLGYINFFTDNYKSVQSVKIHIPSAKVNGYFDKTKHTAADWNRLLNASISGFFDIKGNYINLAYATAELKQYCTDGLELINVYDEITKMEYDIMGLTKYNRIPKNHMFARTVESGLFADGWGAGFARDFMNELANPEKAKTGGSWAIAHELGHVNQIRPGLKWVSTTEVTNNIYSALVRYHFTPNNMPLEHERVNDGDNNNVLGGRFNSFLNYGVVKGEQWLCQRGQDKMEGYENGGDHFVKLCPLWQLLLYYRVAEGTPWRKPDWYADIAEIVRNTNESGMSDGQLQLNFMKNVCDIVKEDLSDFFVKIGMLKPIDKDMDDYARARLTISQADCDQLKQYAKRYKKPASPIIYYMTVNSLDAFQKRLPVAGSYNQGVSVDPLKGTGKISHSVWKNVTVFETYQGQELIKVAMVGTDSEDRSTTLVRYPTGATRIEAVAWDGQRTLVYGQR